MGHRPIEIGTVNYGLSETSLLWSQAESTTSKKHEVTIEGLSADVKYYYSVSGSSGGRSDQYFVTAPGPGALKKIRIWVISDWGQDDTSQNLRRAETVNVWRSFNEGSYHADLALSVGDQTQNDTESDYSSTFFDGLADVLKNTPLYTAAGNHENRDKRAVYKSVFTLPELGQAGGYPSGTEDYYSIDVGNVHIVMLSSEGVSVDGEQTRWLQDDLENNASDWLLAFHHEPMQSAKYRPLEMAPPFTTERENWLPLLENAGVDLIFSGHNHVYERSYLVDNLTGDSNEVTPSNRIDTGLGRPDVAGAYSKPFGCKPHKGTVFVSCPAGGFSNPTTSYASPYSYFPLYFPGPDREGSIVIDVLGRNQMNVKFLCDESDPTGAHVRDYFTIMKTDDITSVGKCDTRAPDNPRVSNYPNPFNRSTRISYSLPMDGRAVIEVYDVLGRKQASLMDAIKEKGNHTVYWDATDQEGRQVSSGVYVLRFQSNQHVSISKMLLLK
ncbi:MAG: metallophosphoesterase [Bacteroidota bacterium]